MLIASIVAEATYACTSRAAEFLHHTGVAGLSETELLGGLSLRPKVLSQLYEELSVARQSQSQQARLPS